MGSMTTSGHAVTGLFRSQCDRAFCIEEAMTTQGVINGGTWTRVVSKGKTYGTTDVGKTLFDTSFAQSSYKILHRSCPSCRSEHKNIYYHRKTSVPSRMSMYDTTQVTWTSTHNRLHVDFE